MFQALVNMNPVRGAIKQADNDSGLVIIDKGDADGVEIGYLLDVVRGRQYIARIKVGIVHAMESYGVASFRAPGTTICIGDKVTNTLN